MNRLRPRAGWVKYGLLATLVAGGGAGGLYLSSGWPGRTPPPAGGDDTGQPAPPATHRFPLTAHDAKDTIEAPALAADPAGRVYLAWASKTGDAERTVFLARTADPGGPFTIPAAVARGGVYKTPAKGNSGGYERRATPHLACDAGRVHLAWSEARPGGAGMRMVLTASADIGTTFGPANPVHVGDRAKPTFTALAFGPGGAVACSWLDDRAGTQQPFAAVRPSGRAVFGPETVVYPGQDGKGVCPCCPTAACFAPDGTLYVAFRNIQGGYRDVAVGRLRPGQTGFDGPFPVVENTWKYDGCPHDGPSLAVAGDTLHVVWMDARSGPQRCYHARARPADLRFEARELHPGVPGMQGNAKLFADAAGGLHAVWEESLGAELPAPAGHAGHQHGPPQVGAGGGRAVMYADMPGGTGDFRPARAVAPRPGAFQTRPSLTVTPAGDVFVAWMDLDEAGKAVVVTRLPRGASRE